MNVRQWLAVWCQTKSSLRFFFFKSSLFGCRRGALGGSLVGLPKAAYPCHIANTCSAPTTDSTQLSTFIKNILGLYITSNACIARGHSKIIPLHKKNTLKHYVRPYIGDNPPCLLKKPNVGHCDVLAAIILFHPLSYFQEINLVNQECPLCRQGCYWFLHSKHILKIISLFLISSFSFFPNL